MPMNEPAAAPRSTANLDELRTLVAIVEGGSLAAAARELGLTPHAISRRLAALEARLGRVLIHRTTRRLSVTAEGQRFAARSQRVLAELAEAEAELVGADGLSGPVRIILHPDLVSPGLMTALAALRARAPALELTVRVTKAFVDPIAAGVDLSIHVGRPPASSLVAVPLSNGAWVLAAAPSYLARHGRPRTPQQLIEHQCLRMIHGAAETHWDLCEEGKRPRRIPVGGGFATDDGPTLTAALYGGLGIGVRLRAEVQAAAATGQLEPILPRWRWAQIPVFAMLPQARTRHAGVRLVLDALRHATAERAR
jgi:LysR family transcriptional activator of dmlA